MPLRSQTNKNCLTKSMQSTCLSNIPHACPGLRRDVRGAKRSRFISLDYDLYGGLLDLVPPPEAPHPQAENSSRLRASVPVKDCLNC